MLETTDINIYISKFLSTHDIANLSYVNSKINRDLQEKLQEEKKKKFDNLMNYFYHMEQYNNTITLRRRYDNNYNNYVKSLFNFLPELFDFIKEKKITYLDISSLTSYGGYPESANKTISNNQEHILEILNQLVMFIRNNKTLTGCNIGLFEHYIVKPELQNTMSMHPTLQFISIQANGATHNFNESPTTLYRNNDGNFEWKHFK